MIRLVMIEHNGKLFARVTDILRPFNDFSKIDQKVLENKARIGTSVHEAIAHDIDGTFPCPDSDALGYFESYIKWKAALTPTFSISERRFFCKEKMITGQIDCLINISASIKLPQLVDFKTSAQESKVVWPMQAHLYHYLLSVNGMLAHPKFLFVKLDKHGNLPEVFEYTWSQNTHAKCMNAIDDFWKSRKVADNK
jgi:hypothetical protein